MMNRQPARRITNVGHFGDVRRRLAVMVVAACLFAGSTAMAGDTGTSAQRFVQQVTSTIVDELTSRRETLRDDPQALHELVDRHILPYFDFERMSRLVLGKKRWKSSSTEQRERFVSAFRSLLVRTYAALLSEYQGQPLTYLDPVPRKREDEIVIPAQLDLSGGQTARIEYAMQGTGTDWKVFDVRVDGVSLVKNYRSSFRSEIARHGIDGLIARLEAKNLATN